MINNIIFNGHVNTNGAHLVGYLYMDPIFLQQLHSFKRSNTDIAKSHPEYTYNKSIIDNSLTFEKIIACLYQITKSNQNMFEQIDYKSTFSVSGTYKGMSFVLYDYKGDKCIHIGGTKLLDVRGLVNEMLYLVQQTKPKKFKTICTYSDSPCIYEYPPSKTTNCLIF